MASLTSFGNDLYTGKRSFNFVGTRKVSFAVAIALVVLSLLVPLVKGGFNFSIEFTGGSQFTVTGVSELNENTGLETIADTVPEANARVTTIGDQGIRLQTDQLNDNDSKLVSAALAEAYGVEASDVTSSYIGASWGGDITKQALLSLVIFLGLTFIVMALYFRTWKMSAAAMIALLDVLVITLGVYAVSGFEVSPATVIGFLTILGYSLYDTVVVFDKIRENTAEESSRTFAESVNLAVNQTLVRSINTSVVAALPVAAILIMGSFTLGSETLMDISLSLLVGILVATYSTIFVAAPLYSMFREKEPEIAARDAQVLAARAKAAEAHSDTP